MGWVWSGGCLCSALASKQLELRENKPENKAACSDTPPVLQFVCLAEENAALSVGNGGSAIMLNHCSGRPKPLLGD